MWTIAVDDAWLGLRSAVLYFIANGQKRTKSEITKARSIMTRCITDMRPCNRNRLMRSDHSSEPNPEWWKGNFVIEKPLYMRKQRSGVR